MSSKTGLLASVILCMVITVALASGVNYMTHQNLTVPSAPAMQLYQSDDTTPIANGQNIVALWTWTGTQFDLTVIIHNTGNTVLSTGLNMTQVPAGWHMTINGNGTLAQGAEQTVTLTCTPNSTAGGTTSGDFDIWWTG